MNHAEDISFGNGRVGSHYKIGTAQCVEVCGVIGEIESAIEQLTKFFGSGWRVNVINGIGGFRGCHVVRFGADAANAIRQQRHLFHRAPDAESFKAAQLGNLKISVGDVALFIQKNFDLAVTF